MTVPRSPNRDCLAGWSALSSGLVAGAAWAMWRVGPELRPWQAALLWIPLAAVVGAGFWLRRAASREAASTSWRQRLLGTVLLVFLFAAIDGGVVFGAAAWRPVTVGAVVVFLLMGWTMDWEKIPARPWRQRAVRRIGYFGLCGLALLVAGTSEPYMAMNLLVFAELLSPMTVYGAPPATEPSDRVGPSQ